MNRFVFFLCLSAFPCVLFGQNVSARVAGLENDQKYMELLGREQQLHRMEDSVVRIIGDTRELFSSHSSPDEREKYGAEILRLEKELYEIRNRIGVTANEIGTIEQEFIVSNMNGSGPSGTVVGPKASGEQVRNLVYNAYFRDHLSAADYRSLLEAQQKETLPGRLIARYMSNYARLDSLAAQYAATSDRQQADEVYSRLSVVRSLNEAIGDSLAGVWGFIYDNKVYAYGYLLDKMDKIHETYPEVGKGNLGVGSTIFAVKPGDGSAREQAASCQKVLGGWANIATEYATKRYRSNLINWGMLPFLTEEDHEALSFKNGDYIFVPNVRKAVEEKADVIKAYVVGDELKELNLKLGDLTDAECEIILDGCLINYYRNH